MKLATLLAFTIALPAVAQTAHWEFSENTSGNNVYWTSSTSVDPNADQYEYQYEITYVAVDVVFLGVIIGPTDVTGDIDPEFLFGTGLVNGPTPIVMMDEALEADADGDSEIDVAANIFMQINGKGFGQFNITEVFLGDVMVDTGFPFGWQNVDIDRIYMDGYMNITPLSNPCPADTNSDGMIDVEDVLVAIGNWGNSGEGDVNGDGIVDVADLLDIIAAWGPC
jgi:hypothetical protein